MMTQEQKTQIRKSLPAATPGRKIEMAHRKKGPREGGSWTAARMRAKRKRRR